jgi:uncharacterized protein YuzE
MGFVPSPSKPASAVIGDVGCRQLYDQVQFYEAGRVKAGHTAMQNPPDWWSFELELSGHVLDRMLDRGFSEADLRMKSAYLNVTYRHGRPIAAYYHLPRRSGDVVATTDEAGEGMLVDYAADGRPIGIEITEPTLLDLVDFDRLLSSLGCEPAAREDLAPLVAA